MQTPAGGPPVGGGEGVDDVLQAVESSTNTASTLPAGADGGRPATTGAIRPIPTIPTGVAARSVAAHSATA